MPDLGGPGFEVRVSQTDRVVVMSVQGDLDALTAPRLIEEMDAVLSGHPDTLIVDLLDVTFLASVGMATLLHGNHTAGSTRFGVVATGPIIRPFRTMGLDRELNIYPTLDAALA